MRFFFGTPRKFLIVLIVSAVVYILQRKSSRKHTKMHFLERYFLTERMRQMNSDNQRQKEITRERERERERENERRIINKDLF